MTEARRRPRGVSVYLPEKKGDDGTVVHEHHEYPKADGWRLDDRVDGTWLHIDGPSGEQIASFRPGTYDRPESIR